MFEKPPIYNALVQHKKKNPVSFHVPGHKMGQGFNSLGSKYYKNILEIDMTEITGLDNLHQAEEIILEAQQEAANLYHAEQTFFLVNGTTVGNLALILTVCQPGDRIIVQRNVHKSVINGIILAHAEPIYINPDIIDDLEVSACVKTSTVEAALKKYPDAKAVFLMNPNYYGLSKDLTEIIALTHRYQIPLLVDEAHGAHFGLHPAFPKSAIQLGADAVVQSTHKTLSAMTMGSLLHVHSNYLDISRLKVFLSMLQSSSPSYPIMASLDLTVNWLKREGEQVWNHVLESIDWFYEKAKHLKHIKVNYVLPEEYQHDPLKIVIQHEGLSGYRLQELLEKENIYLELADMYNCLAVASIGTMPEDLEKLLAALKRIDKVEYSTVEMRSTPRSLFEQDYDASDSNSSVSLGNVLYQNKKRLPIREAIGYFSAEMVIPYPPGVPMIQLGERITKEMVNYLIYLKEQGAKFTGINDTSFQSILVTHIED